MLRRLFVLSFLLPIGGVNAQVIPGNETRNGGDPLFILALDAKKGVEELFAKLDPAWIEDEDASLPGGSTSDWFNKNQSELGRDLAGSTIEVRDRNPNGQCAQTEPDVKNATIFLARSTCPSTSLFAKDDVMRLLVNEVAHHFGANNVIAARRARAISNAWAFGVPLFGLYEGESRGGGFSMSFGREGVRLTAGTTQRAIYSLRGYWFFEVRLKELVRYNRLTGSFRFEGELKRDPCTYPVTLEGIPDATGTRLQVDIWYPNEIFLQGDDCWHSGSVNRWRQESVVMTKKLPPNPAADEYQPWKFITDGTLPSLYTKESLADSVWQWTAFGRLPRLR